MNRQQEVTVAEKKEAKLTEEEANTDKNASIVTTRLNEFYEDRSSTEEKRKQEIVEIEYEVVLGDTLWGIAKQHDVTVRSIMERNKLQSDLLIPGQKLTVVLLKDHVYTINTSIEEITK
ncbi:LysM peptidoglycan-binding domain-containing protein [Bacillus aquiflavi]|nr:LysM peptidoglycan-binding domain-containing protein [Bacillus aquiflavi]UAC50050.1 LysM peptidoglycan-binding domain-containing protein [Bacillus aquiflavi]